MAFASGIHGNTNPLNISRYKYVSPNNADAYVEDNALELIYGVGNRYNKGNYYSYNNSDNPTPSELLSTLNGQRWLGRSNWRLFPAFAIGNDGRQIETWKCYYTANKGEIPSAFNNGQWYGNTGTTYEHHLKQWGNQLYYMGQYNLSPELAGKGHYIHHLKNDAGSFKLVPISFNNGQMEADNYSDWSQYQLPIVDAFDTDPWYEADVEYKGEVGDNRYNRRDDGYMKMTLKNIEDYLMLNQNTDGNFGFKYNIEFTRRNRVWDGKTDANTSGETGNIYVSGGLSRSANNGTSSTQHTFSNLGSAIYKFKISDIFADNANRFWNNAGATAGDQKLGGTITNFDSSATAANQRAAEWSITTNAPSSAKTVNGFTDFKKSLV
tara:strand:- start:218 stop:1357 length:1140 start_codon:yes stop_codon:yes gene_type:complete